MARAFAKLNHVWQKNWPEVWCLLRGGMPSFVTHRRARLPNGAVPVFHYHVVQPDQFEEDLRFLDRNGYSTVTADELLDHLQYKTSLSTRAVVLSFDDGPLNLYHVAYPLLRQYDQRAVAFISPGLHCNDLARSARNRLCRWDEIRRMHESGTIDFQSHTLEHRFVPRWPQPWPLLGVDNQEITRGPALPLDEDLKQAKQLLEQRLGKTINHLAFPNYRTTRQASQVAVQVGYRGLWLGTLPARPCNVPGHSWREIVRLSGEFVQRLPGRGRQTLTHILSRRYASSFHRMTQRIRRGEQHPAPASDLGECH